MFLLSIKCVLHNHQLRQVFDSCKLGQIHFCEDDKLSHNALIPSSSDGETWLENDDLVPPTGPWKAWEALQQSQEFTQEVPAT